MATHGYDPNIETWHDRVSTRLSSPNRILLISLITLLCFYSHITYRELTLAECMSTPEACHGKSLRVGNDAKTGVVHSDRFELIKGRHTITVFGSMDELVENTHVDLQATFHRDGYLALETMYIRTLRQWKIVISVIPVFLIGWMVWRQYRFDFQRRLFVER